MEKVVFDITSPEYRKDPYPVYAHFREHDPVHYFTFKGFQEEVPSWLITRYDDCVALLRDNRLTKDVNNIFSKEDLQKRSEDRDLAFLSEHMLMKDPPDHTRLRSLVHQVFTPRMIENLRTRIEEIADQLLDEMEKKSTGELLSDFAFPLPIIVISEMMGIPPEKREQFRIWSNALIDESNDESKIKDTQLKMKAFKNYIGELIKARREHPTDDVISGLVQAEENGEKLSEEELFSMLFLLIIAGHETTVNLIANGTLALLKHPDQFKRLKEQPELIGTAVEELLRFTNPVQITTQRWANEDFVFHGQPIKKGDGVWIAIGSANRDPAQFEKPEKLDIGRTPNRHIAFGFGIHFCLGAPLARLEGQIALNALFKRFPHMELAIEEDQIKWRNASIFRGLVELPVRFS
ncbi:cytochrome P450 [Hazenella sp. IB182357]|uniref:Cytochrome P450 n=1 Tax=Polycladospora coralii TaxID=2771432 RepID=A0A926RV21_9BACL|nr:cytochrome P450 [Polycladospora coralii]MBD1373079.1 cytochrome P450 [Polycladospora coralii]